MSEVLPQEDPSQIQPPQEVQQPLVQPMTAATHIDIRDGQPAQELDDSGNVGQINIQENDVSKAWAQAHDEKYAREGKTKLLGAPKKRELMAASHKSNAVDYLYKAYLSGEHITVDFNGELMNSREIGELGIDKAYEKYFGYDKESYQEHERLKRAAWSAKYALEQFESEYKAKKEVPKLVEESAELIKPNTGGEWRDCLEARAADLYKGADSRAAIDLMKAHSQGASQEELQRLLDQQGHSGASRRMTMAMIKHFYKQGNTLVGSLS